MKRPTATKCSAPDRPTALASPTPRGDLSGSLAVRFLSLRALIPPPRSTTLLA